MDDDLKRYLDQNFQQFGQQIQQLHVETAQQFQEMRERMDGLEEDIRGSYILTENLSGEVRLVAEGVDNLREQMKRMDERLSRKIEDVMTFTRQAYRDLDARKLDKTA